MSKRIRVLNTKVKKLTLAKRFRIKFLKENDLIGKGDFPQLEYLRDHYNKLLETSWALKERIDVSLKHNTYGAETMIQLIDRFVEIHNEMISVDETRTKYVTEGKMVLQPGLVGTNKPTFKRKLAKKSRKGIPKKGRPSSK